MNEVTGVTEKIYPRRKHRGRVNNTCAPSSKRKRLERQLAGIMAHLEKNPGDNLSRVRVSRIKELLDGRE